MAESIGEACVEEMVKAFSLLGGEAGAEVVGFGPGEIDLVVSDVQVAAKDDGFGVAEFSDEFPEGDVPALSVEDSAETVLGVGSINRDEVKLRILEGDDASFGIVFFDSHADV